MEAPKAKKDRVIPKVDWPVWIQKLVTDLEDVGVGDGVELVYYSPWVGAFPNPKEILIDFRNGSKSHSALLLRGILDKGYGKLFMRWFLFPALLAQGMGSVDDDE